MGLLFQILSSSFPNVPRQVLDEERERKREKEGILVANSG